MDAEALAQPGARSGTTDAADSGLIDEIAGEALRRGATKIHLEPQKDGGLTVRFRVAGGLAEASRLPPHAAAGVAQRLAATPIRLAGRDVEVSRFGIGTGERIVLHLGAPARRSTTLEALGMRPELAQSLALALGRRGGLAIVAGPPGSGRSTTLTALARELESTARCVLPLPVEGTIAERFAAVMRQDPDAILAGSIPDRQTAAAAVRAAEAGHLVLAKIDALDAISAILRLRELRVEPFQLASTLHAVLAQRLARRLCGDCREPVQAEASVSALLGFDAGAVVYAPVGCGSCESGHRGMSGVFEAILPDAALRRLINDGGDGAILARHAFLNAPNLGSAARALVREGVTTAEEAVRLSRS
ncbi:ATPase, T2SS/T4P/T4SS family [Sphingomonas sp.]|uniref:GspE/PulE family protein n=1 Tax=Sphingomonas sp. TaxID=28214 RepID=UPI001B190987|nr:ATPase, T2SS/T4P/T4SS family [Sphingomonas sp.]MBO9712544.1 Flp pilus assembly complex ATPase component TadA [Sphingomonas sp.]